ncbi:hypothetical protein [Saccharomonospora piscinae]|uniref:Uncharacterized protein n=1 Tax=Saccharomonospora piscinae TaxID=687388 RepID=A0A1V9A0G5_SACPI|nr:hypothetical protein [Saccharomonospora piscinae]OQO90642.1 hypothetical protein B1813_13885 [Saccharomonospora piscinae]TLW93309.1 hypothetical protein FFT09_07820 [Saccharomonospora piscinae]
MTATRFPQLEPMAQLDWAEAVEQGLHLATAASPADARHAWIHRAPEHEVLARYRATCACSGFVPSPWWLRAVATGRLRCRDDGFRVEDRIHALLSKRPGWEYVPWAVDGESGFWEFLPSERGETGHRIPTSILLTDRHTGWIDVLAAHSAAPPEPVAVAGLAGLRARAGQFEALR